MHVCYDWGLHQHSQTTRNCRRDIRLMSAVRFVLLVLALASTEATAFAFKLRCRRVLRTDDPGHACFTIAEQQIVVAKLPPQPLRATEDHVTAKERDTEPGYASNNAMIKIASPGLDCIYANDAGNRVESIDHHGTATKCGDPRTGGTLVPGHVSEDHAAYNRTTGQFQVTSYNDGKVYFRQVRCRHAIGGRWKLLNGLCWLRLCNG